MRLLYRMSRTVSLDLLILLSSDSLGSGTVTKLKVTKNSLYNMLLSHIAT
jgi:hypothetical protein